MDSIEINLVYLWIFMSREIISLEIYNSTGTINSKCKIKPFYSMSNFVFYLMLKLLCSDDKFIALQKSLVHKEC